ncbi:MAG: hypothetical protein IT260_23640 [Saprospiraceae bacterium]|nr:hypothetical protein [Saprospiraceae bacterium]
MNKQLLLCASLCCALGLCGPAALMSQTTDWQAVLPGFSLYTENVFHPDSFSLESENIRTEEGRDSLIWVKKPVLDHYRIKAIVRFDSLPELRSLTLQLGSAQGQADILQHTFHFDRYEGLPEGLSYFRDGNLLLLSLGDYPQAFNAYSGQLQLTDIWDNVSPTVSFTTY